MSSDSKNRFELSSAMAYHAAFNDVQVSFELSRLVVNGDLPAPVMQLPADVRREILERFSMGQDVQHLIPPPVPRPAPVLDDAGDGLVNVAMPQNVARSEWIDVAFRILTWLLVAFYAFYLAVFSTLRWAVSNSKAAWAIVVFLLVGYISPLMVYWGVSAPAYFFGYIVAYSTGLYEVFVPARKGIPYVPMSVYDAVQRSNSDLMALAMICFAVLASLLVVYMILALFVTRKVSLFSWDRRYIEPPLKDNGCKGNYVPERMVRGSDFMSSTLPAFQMWVEIKTSGKWVKAGCAFRTAQGIITAKHVMNGADFRLTTTKSIVEVPYSKVRELDIDVVVIPGVYAPQGVSEAKLARGALMDNDTMQVEISNGVNRSVGPLVCSKSFGCVVYSGSTCGGFSGAPYYSGKNILGVHVGAADVNFGYEASYLHSLIVVKEDSDRYFMDILRRGGALSHRISPYDPDEVIVRHRGGYHRMDRSKFYGAQEENDNDYWDNRVYEQVFGYDGMPSRASGGGGSSENRYTKRQQAAMRGGGGYWDGRHKKESGIIFDDSGNVELPAVSVTQSVGRPRNTHQDVLLESSRISHAIPSRSPQTFRREVTERPQLTSVPRSEASVCTLKNTLRELLEISNEQIGQTELNHILKATHHLKERLKEQSSKQ